MSIHQASRKKKVEKYNSVNKIILKIFEIFIVKSASKEPFKIINKDNAMMAN